MFKPDTYTGHEVLFDQREVRLEPDEDIVKDGVCRQDYTETTAEDKSVVNICLAYPWLDGGSESKPM